MSLGVFESCKFYDVVERHTSKTNILCHGHTNRVNLVKPIALRKAKIAYNFSLTECSRIKLEHLYIVCKRSDCCGCTCCPLSAKSV